MKVDAKPAEKDKKEQAFSPSDNLNLIYHATITQYTPSVEKVKNTIFGCKEKEESEKNYNGEKQSLLEKRNSFSMLRFL